MPLDPKSGEVTGTEAGFTPHFAAFIAAYKTSKGSLDVELSDALEQVHAGVRLTGGKGKVVLELEVTPANKDSTGANIALAVVPKIKVTIPRRDVGGRIVWADQDGALTGNDPDQLRIV